MHHVVVGPVERPENDKKVASQSLKNPFFEANFQLLSLNFCQNRENFTFPTIKNVFYVM